MINNKCLGSGLGHDFVTISRGDEANSESWMECYLCHKSIGELENGERNCPEHSMRCFRCGFPLMKERAEKLAKEPPIEWEDR